jgi:hypothetical protein
MPSDKKSPALRLLGNLPVWIQHFSVIVAFVFGLGVVWQQTKSSEAQTVENKKNIVTIQKRLSDIELKQTSIITKQQAESVYQKEFRQNTSTALNQIIRRLDNMAGHAPLKP